MSEGHFGGLINTTYNDIQCVDDPCACGKCVYGEYGPPPGAVCKGKTYTQRAQLEEDESHEDCFEVDYNGPQEVGTGEPEWDCEEWDPPESNFCETVLVDQTRFCADVAGLSIPCESETESRKVNGTKNCDDPTCVYSEWSPSPDNYCNDQEFTQTRYVLSGALEICDNIERQTMGTADCDCQYGDWEPDESAYCEGVPFQQSAERIAGLELCPQYIYRDAIGTKDCDPNCEYSEWFPRESDVCEGQEFTQTRYVLSGSLEECNNISKDAVGTKYCPRAATCADFNLSTEGEGCPEGQLASIVTKAAGSVAPNGNVVDLPGLTCYECYDDPDSCISGSNIQNEGTTGKNPEDPCNDFLTVLTLPAKYTGMYSCTGTGDDQAEVNGILFPASQPEIGPCYGTSSINIEVSLSAGEYVTCIGGSWGGRVGCTINCCLVGAP